MLDRRGFLEMVPIAAFRLKAEATEVPNGFPAQEPDVVKEMVTVAHGNVARVKELVTARPALARASWDWGYGDWETAIDAASHVGNRPIAEFLIANGARPTFLTSVMLGQLAQVKSWIEASPGIQRTRGPHGLTAMAHARAGGAGAAEVAKYLESLGDADPKYPDIPLTDAEQAAIVGEYAFGPGPMERLKVAKGQKTFSIQRPGSFERALTHVGNLAFSPAGAEAVRIRFELDGGKARALSVEDGSLVVRAQRA